MAATFPDTHLDLLDAPGVAALSTIGADGVPQTTAVWYRRDGDVMKLSLDVARQKTKNLLANPVANLFIIDPTNPFRTLEVRADATFEDDGDLSFFQSVFAHYDADTAMVPEGERKIVTLTPRRVVAIG